MAYDPRGNGKAAHLRVWAALDLAPLKGDGTFLSALADISVDQGSDSRGQFWTKNIFPIPIEVADSRCKQLIDVKGREGLTKILNNFQ